MIDRFNDEICDDLGCYVYRLIDPRTAHTFYVGKGTGNRVFAHAKGELDDILRKESGSREILEDCVSLKSSQIRDIMQQGLEVISVIHRHGMDKKTAFEVEAALMDVYPALTNAQGGYASNQRGCMSPEEVITRYGLPAITDAPNEKLILLNINSLENRYDCNAVYEQTRLAWRANIKRAESAKYVLGVERGVVRGVFIADKWEKALQANFPGRLQEDMPSRIGFHGRPADDVWSELVGDRGKRIAVRAMKHVQNPVRYWRI